jgi:phospholipase C
VSGDLSRRRFLAAGAGAVTAAGLARATRFRRIVDRAAAVPAAGRELDAIEHVVIVMQENRSFDHYFGTYPGVRGFDDRPKRRDDLGVFAQARSDGTRVLPFRLDAASDTPMCAGDLSVPTHDWVPQHVCWDDGRLDDFVKVHDGFDGDDQGPLVMGYFTRDGLPLYHALADAFTICDAWYCSMFGPTMPNRLLAMTGTIDPDGLAGGPIITTPTADEAPALVGSCSWETMFERLNDAGVSWKVYQQPGTSVGPNLSTNLSVAYNALLCFRQFQDPSSELYRRAFLPVWPDEFHADVEGGTLPQVTWIKPPLVDSEHPSAAPTNGEVFLSGILDALVANRRVWERTVMFVMHDENGGFFDHVPPPTPPAGTPGEELTVDPLPETAGNIRGPIGLGFRVPALVVSPFSRGGHVNSRVFDHTSLLRFLEARFGPEVPNLSRWRRRHTGDLTSTLDLGQRRLAVPRLPSLDDAVAKLNQECPDSTDPASLQRPPPTLTVPTDQRMPRQERRRT